MNMDARHRPSVLDENYLFASTTPDHDKDAISYGFRVMVSSASKKHYHFRRFLFPNLGELNAFIGAVSSMTNNAAATLTKADFFKAPRYDLPIVGPGSPENAFGDHFNAVTSLVR